CDGMGLRSSLLTALLSHEADIHVIGATSSIRDALNQISHCDVLLLGNSLPRLDALELAGAAARAEPQVLTIAVGFRAREPLLTSLLQAGASGYVLQDATVANFLTTI